MSNQVFVTRFSHFLVTHVCKAIWIETVTTPWWRI